jgi:hypothetical protein
VSDKKDQSYNTDDINIGWESPCPSQDYIVQGDYCNMGMPSASVTATTTSLDISNMGAAGSVYAIDTTDTIDLSSITIGSGGNTTINSNPYTFSTWETKNTLNGVEEIHTKSGKKIDVDELAEVVETIKKRLLILTPNFEMHEKYPMLKELYEEYKALEKLLGGPDNEENNG